MREPRDGAAGAVARRVSCDERDPSRAAPLSPRFVSEVSSPKTARADTGRKIADHPAIATLEAYVVVDRPRRALTAYRADAGPRTCDAGAVPLGEVSLAAAALLA